MKYFLRFLWLLFWMPKCTLEAILFGCASIVYIFVIAFQFIKYGEIKDNSYLLTPVMYIHDTYDHLLDLINE